VDLSAPARDLHLDASRHLAGLLGEAERLAGCIRTAPEARRVELACARTDAAILATLGLDGSPLTEIPDLETVAAPRPIADSGQVPRNRQGTWLDAMRTLEDAPDEHLQALEVLGARAGLGSEDLASRLCAEPLAALEELHRRLTHGLVAEERAGRPRRVEQAVHDASTGRVLYFTTDPDAIEAELVGLAAWLTGQGDAHPVVISGILHLELLRIHPFDAANGRLARTAARLVLRAGGLDPEGLACPEPQLAADALGYHEEVASTARRRDATIWLERWAEAVSGGLRRSARDLEVLPAQAPDAVRAALAELDSDAFTIADYREQAEVDAQRAREDLGTLLDSGEVARVPGSRGLRYRRRA
jgi:Fic family protein